MSDEKKISKTSKEDRTEDIDSRRKVLRKILIGGGIAAGAGFLPDKWAKPVVDFIVVPAHAQLSPTAPTTAPTNAPTSAPT